MDNRNKLKVWLQQTSSTQKRPGSTHSADNRQACSVRAVKSWLCPPKTAPGPCPDWVIQVLSHAWMNNFLSNKKGVTVNNARQKPPTL